MGNLVANADSGFAMKPCRGLMEIALHYVIHDLEQQKQGEDGDGSLLGRGGVEDGQDERRQRWL
jgi:hypothetical protein